MKILEKIDETNYTSELKTAIDTEVNNLSKLPSRSSVTPHSTKQKAKDFKLFSNCFDLLKLLPNSKILLLEVKTTTDLQKFDSYSYNQHKVNIEFFRFGIPVNYCYNTKDDYSDRGDNIYTLKYSLTANPEDVCDSKGSLINKEKHVSLLELIHKLLVSDSNDNYYSALLFAFFNEGVLKSINQLNLSYIFIAFNPKTKLLLSLNMKDLAQIANTFYKTLELKKELFDFSNSTSLEIKQYLKEQSTVLVEAVNNYNIKKKQKRKKSKGISF